VRLSSPRFVEALAIHQRMHKLLPEGIQYKINGARVRFWVVLRKEARYGRVFEIRGLVALYNGASRFTHGEEAEHRKQE